MERLNEATNPAQILMTGARHLGLLTLDCDQGLDVLSIAGQAFGERSLEASMALHWAAAASLSTDSSLTSQDAADLLNHHPEPPPQIGHQATVRKLLSVTPELNFDWRLRRIWLRRALYENAFRSRWSNRLVRSAKRIFPPVTEIEGDASLSNPRSTAF
jgi:hypothetical protein